MWAPSRPWAGSTSRPSAHLQPGGHRQTLHRPERHHRGRPAQRPDNPLLRCPGHPAEPVPHRPGHRASPEHGRGKPQNHAYQLYLAVEDIGHSRTKANHPQTNGIRERFHKTLQDECYSLLCRKKLYRSLEELQEDLDAWPESYNRERPHSGRYCYGKTPWETFAQSKHLALAKDLSRGGDQPDITIQQPAAVS